jgi:hypothetical protein
MRERRGAVARSRGGCAQTRGGVGKGSERHPGGAATAQREGGAGPVLCARRVHGAAVAQALESACVRQEPVDAGGGGLAREGGEDACAPCHEEVVDTCAVVGAWGR